MTEPQRGEDRPPRWLRRDSERSCLWAGALLGVMAVAFPVIFIIRDHWIGSGLGAAVVLEAVLAALAVGYLRSGFYKRRVRLTLESELQ